MNLYPAPEVFVHRWISLISISVVIISVAFFTSGGCEVLLGPAQKAYPTPSAFVDTPIGEQSGNIEISYRIVDIEGDPVSITVGYSTDSGKTWFPATEGPGSEGTTGLTSNVFPGSHHVFVWDSVTDEIGYSTSVRIRITPDDGSSTSLEGETANFTVVNAISGAQTPVIGWFAAPQGTVQQVPLTFAWKNLTPEVPIYRYYYGLDEDPPTHKTTKTSVKILPPSHGPHTFRVFAMGASGLNSAVITRSFNVSEGSQNEAPSVEILTGPSGTIAETSVSFTWRGVDPDGDVYCYYYNLDDQGWVNVGLWKSASFTELVPGDHTFALYCKDWYGADSVTVYRNFTIDPSYTNFLPTVAITGGPSGGTADNTPTFTWSGADPDGQVVGYYWRLDAGNETFTSMTQVTLSPLADGSYRFYVKSVDDYGANSSEAWRDFTVMTGPGNLPPSVSITSGPTGDTTDTTPSFTWIGSDPDGGVAGYFWRVDSGAETYTTSTFVTLPPQTEAPHTFYVKAIDDAGDNSTTDSRSFTIVPPGSNDPPTVTITGGPTGNTSDNTPTFTYIGSDTDGTVTGYYWHVDAGPETYTISTSATTSALADGPHTFFVKAVDNDGDNSTEDSRAFTVATGGGPATDFLETFDDGTVDPDLSFILNGAATQSVTGGAWFFDQGTSASDAHLWYYKKPLDFSRPFVARVRTKTDSYIASAVQGCHTILLYATNTGTFQLHSGGSAPSYYVNWIHMAGAEDGFCNGQTKLCFTSPPDHWKFSESAWNTGGTLEDDFGFNYEAATFITFELWSTPTSFYMRALDESGALLCETGLKNWSEVPQVAAGDDIYLCGGESLTSWWSNDQWIDYIQVDYEPDPPATISGPYVIGNCTVDGDAQDVVVVGNYAYVPSYTGLFVIDVSDPSAPFIAGNCTTPGTAYGVDVSGGYAYVADGTSGLQVIDISSPTNPQIVGNLDCAGEAKNLHVVGDKAYVANGSQGLLIVDISTPSNPTYIGSVDTPGGWFHDCYDVYAEGIYAYVSDQDSIQVVDVSNPAAPTIVGSYDTYCCWGIKKYGPHVYLAEDGDGLRIFDVETAPTSPDPVGVYVTPNCADGIFVAAGYAYVADRTGLVILDITDPTSPTHVATVDTPGMPVDVYVKDGYAYIADNQEDLQIIKLDNNSNVVTINETFDDGALDSRFATHSAGTCTFFENASAGLFQVDMGTSSGDAGIVYLKDAIDISKPMVIKHRSRVKGATGMHAWEFFDLHQSVGYPQCGSGGSNTRICALVRAPNMPLHNGAIQIFYVNAGGTSMVWDETITEWVLATPTEPWVDVTVSDFHLAELHSDGSQWYVIFRDQSGVILMQTTPVSWSDVYDTGEDYRFFWGDDRTNYFYGDGESDYINISYTPK